MLKRIIFALFTCMIGLYGLAQSLGAQTDSSDINLLLTVQDTSSASIVRSTEPVTSGIPLPESAGIKDVQTLMLMDDTGTAVPAQFKVRSRWHGPVDDETLPIRWVLADFQATVPTGGTAAYRLSVTGKQIPAFTDSITLQDDEAQLVIDTGAARFAMNKQYFNLFDKVWSNAGKLLVNQSGRGGIVLTDGQDKTFTALNRPPELFEIEEAGPLRTVVRVRGILQTSDGEFFAPAVNNSEEWPRFSQPYKHSFFYYDCRIHFYAGKDFVKVLFTLENNGANARSNPEKHFAPSQPVYFDKVLLDLHLVEQPETSGVFGNETLLLSSSSNLSLLQDWRETTENTRNGTLVPGFEEGIFYTIHHNNELIENGMAHPGWVHLQSETANISLGVRHFWQNFPKKIMASPSLLRLGLWPEEGYYPYCSRNDFPEDEYALYCHDAGREAGLYLFDAGRHKTHEFVLSFAEDNHTTASAQLAAFLEHPLMAMAPAEWYAETGALGLIAPDNLQTGTSEIDEALRRFDQLQLAMVNENYSDNEWTIHKLKTASPPKRQYNRQYRYFGWMGFGDLLWTGQSACALHYDWPYSMLLHYLRTGHRKFFDTAVEMARHRYDIDQYHGDREDSRGNHVWTNHMAFYESDRHSDPSISSYNPARVSMNSHTWNGGLILYHLLTGDPRAWDAAKQNGQAAFNMLETQAENPSCAQKETRQETWPMLNLINLYRVSGEQKYLQLAKNIAKNRLLYREQQAGGRGNFGSGSDCDAIDGTVQASTLYAYAIDPILQTHFETQDKNLADLIVRMADFTKDQFLFGGDTNEEGKYLPLQSLYVWKEDDPEGIAAQKRGEPVKNLFWADLFAYAYRLTGDRKYLNTARQTFRDAMFYYTTRGSRYIDPSSRSTISFIDNMFSGSETKVHGWIGRTNQIYLNMEYAILLNKTTAVLRDTSPDHTITAGSDTRIYGSSNANWIVLETGARGELINFPGYNSIEIQSPSETFTVARSGSVVIFQGSDGTFLKIPATTSEQTISFADGMIVTLTIDNNQVMLGDRTIGTEPEPLSNGA